MLVNLENFIENFKITLCLSFGHILFYAFISTVVALLDLAVIILFSSLLTEDKTVFFLNNFDVATKSIFLIIVAFSSLLISSYSTWLLYSLSQTNGALLQKKIYSAELTNASNDIRSFETSKLLTLIGHDAVKFTNSVFTPILVIFSRLLQGLIIIFGLIFSNLYGVAFFVTFALIYIATFRYSRDFLKFYSFKIRENSKELNALIESSGRGIIEILSNQLNNLMKRKVGLHVDIIASSQAISSMIILLPKIVIENILFVGIGVLFIFMNTESSTNLVIYTGASLVKLLPVLQAIYTSVSTIINSYSQVDSIKKSLTQTLKKSNLKFSINIKNLNLTIVQKIFDNIPSNITIYRGFPCVITGASGTGKTTFLMNLAGLNSEKVNFSFDIKQKISVTSQSPWIMPGTLYENILGNHKINDDKALKLNLLLERMYTEEIRQKLIKSPDITKLTLSGGEKQKLVCVRTMLSDKEILLFDEPTSALDKVSTNIFLNLLDEYCKNKFCILISHNNQVIKSYQNIIQVN